MSHKTYEIEKSGDGSTYLRAYDFGSVVITQEWGFNSENRDDRGVEAIGLTRSELIVLRDAINEILEKD